jgi:hypothetical protein
MAKAEAFGASFKALLRLPLFLRDELRFQAARRQSKNRNESAYKVSGGFAFLRS